MKKNAVFCPQSHLQKVVEFFVPTFGVCVFCLPVQAYAAELSVESTVDSTPTEIRQLVERSNTLEAKIRELEKRIDTTQRSVLGVEDKSTVDYRLELKPFSATSPDENKTDKLVVSHIRMAMDGRPFVYTQSALIVSENNPLPLFVGRIPEGKHQVRLQFQVSPYGGRFFAGSKAAWKAIDRIFEINIQASGGNSQVQTVTIMDETKGEVSSAPKAPENKKPERPLIIDEFRKETR
ncbi:MAG: hypothetical protein ACO3A4_08205 [Silvanigrellaceae bacterium]